MEINTEVTAVMKTEADSIGNTGSAEMTAWELAAELINGPDFPIQILCGFILDTFGESVPIHNILKRLEVSHGSIVLIPEHEYVDPKTAVRMRVVRS
jgi:hypothetical protein